MKYMQYAVKGFPFLDSAVVSERVYDMVQFVEGAMSSVKGTINEWVVRSQGRKDLARLSPRMWRDIGLEPFEVYAEINKPFWKK